MKKIKFPSHEATCCDSERTETTQDVKDRLKRQKATKKTYLTHIHACKTLLDSYEYDNNNTYGMLGRAFANLTNIGIDIKNTKKQLKGMKK